MVTLLKTSPCISLSLFIRNYQLLEFDTPVIELQRPWHASMDLHIVFFLKDKPIHLLNEKNGYYVKGGHQIAVLGPSDQFNGLMKFKGNYSCFLVEFMPGGFAKTFRLQMDNFMNKIYDADELFGNPANTLLCQLQNTASFQEMAGFADNFFCTVLSRQKKIYTPDGIASISKLLLVSKGKMPIEKYASMANMSLRNFERRFGEQVGLSPKLFCRLMRFNEAVTLKMENPHMDWTSIAHECGYFDQMHMIKEFKQFAGASPSQFFGSTPPPPVETIMVKRTAF